MESSHGGTGHASCSSFPTTLFELLTMPETLQKTEASIQGETLPHYLASCLLRAHLSPLLYLPSCYRQFSSSFQKATTSTRALDPMPLDPGTVLFILAPPASSPFLFFTGSLH